MTSELNLELADPKNRLKVTAVAHIKGLKHAWNRDRVLFDIDDATWLKGQVVWLQGENGTGKSTLMRLMAGLEGVQQGAVSFPWHNTGWLRARGRGQICYLHQTPYLFAGTVQKNLDFVLNNLPRKRRAQALERLEHGLEMAALTHLVEQDASTLSGGERQRLALLRAWLLQPRVLLLDEPAANLDQKSVTLMKHIVLNLLEKNTDIMLSSHQNCDLTSLCNHAWQIENGLLYA